MPRTANLKPPRFAPPGGAGVIRAAAFLTLLASSAVAGGPAWEDMIAEPDPFVQLMGAVAACANAVTDPQSIASHFVAAGWETMQGEEGTIAFQTKTTSVMFWQDPGFCMLDTSLMNTEGLTRYLTAAGIAATGSDAEGCAQFAVPDTNIVATLTGPGNDPVCTSPAGSTLRFEAAP